MHIDFHNLIVVITGAASGIGLATSEMYIKEGATVILLDINPKGAREAEILGSKAHYIPCDVSNSTEVERAFNSIKLIHKQVDILVNNAGIQSYGKVTDMSEDVWDQTFAVNVKSIFLCSKFAIPLMSTSLAPVIVNVASVKSFVCQNNEVAYVASKSAILGITQSIAADYAPHIRCVAVCPGAVNTPMLTNELDQAINKAQLINETEKIHLLQRIANAEEIGNFILFLSSTLASFATGHAYRVDGGIGVRIEGA